jgi:hypothetical protein
MQYKPNDSKEKLNVLTIIIYLYQYAWGILEFVYLIKSVGSSTMAWRVPSGCG